MLGFEKALFVAGLLFFCAIPFVVLLDARALPKGPPGEAHAVEI